MQSASAPEGPKREFSANYELATVHTEAVAALVDDLAWQTVLARAGAGVAVTDYAVGPAPVGWAATLAGIPVCNDVSLHTK